MSEAAPCSGQWLHCHCVCVCVAVGCDDARIRVWRVPEGGSGGTQKESEFFLIGEKNSLTLTLTLTHSLLEYV